MALFNEIQVGRFNRYVQKLFAIKGGPPMPTLASDLQMIYPFKTGQENRYLEGWDLYGRTLTVTGLAGNASIFVVRNPKGSNAIAVISKAAINEHLPDPVTGGSTGAQFFAILNATTDEGTLVQAQAMDARTVRQSSMIVSHNQGTAVVAVGGQANALGLVGLIADQTYNFISGEWDEIPVLPGSAVYMANGVAAQAATFMFQWRERFLEDSERQ